MNHLMKTLNDDLVCLFSYDLENRIKSYNMSNWDFRGLHDFFKYHLDAEGNASKQFFTGIIPKMVELMMKTSEIMTQPLPLLKSGTSGSITFSQQQVFYLVVVVFFCFPTSSKNFKSSSNRIFTHKILSTFTCLGCSIASQRIFLYFSSKKCPNKKR